jgi:hypothetical protein
MTWACLGLSVSECARLDSKALHPTLSWWGCFPARLDGRAGGRLKGRPTCTELEAITEPGLERG